MGCANAKPPTYTKRPLNGSLIPKSSGINSHVENPEINNPLRPIINANKQSMMKGLDQKNPKSNLADIQKNSTLTRKQVIEEAESRERQRKNLQTLPKQETIANKTKANNLQQIKSQRIDKIKSQEKLEFQQPNLGSQIPVRQFNPKVQEQISGLQVIAERKPDSEVTKKIELSSMKIQQQHSFNLNIPTHKQNAQSQLKSSGVPEMGEGCIVSKLSIFDQLPELSYRNSAPPTQNNERSQPYEQLKNPKMTSILNTQKVINNDGKQQIKGSQSALNQDNNKNFYQNAQISGQNQKTTTNQNNHAIIKEHNQITTQQIRINVHNQNQKHNMVSLNDDQFTALTEESFDLSCSFDPSALTIDMNKISW